ncbi:GpE family phage tail protein [Deferribacter autotrophicus]|uniref:GpE family phage tail protein n=1 Tax=Deferribacter autotrophicus TaxID=500465 RepID=A0A5A8F3Y9_9BACT|nr:GpE family phage tail protein [Deferribacter autotrophicus]
MRKVAFVFKFPPSEIKELTLNELEIWRGAADEIMADIASFSGGDT